VMRATILAGHKGDVFGLLEESCQSHEGDRREHARFVLTAVIPGCCCGSKWSARRRVGRKINWTTPWKADFEKRPQQRLRHY